MHAKLSVVHRLAGVNLTRQSVVLHTMLQMLTPLYSLTPLNPDWQMLRMSMLWLHLPEHMRACLLAVCWQPAAEVDTFAPLNTG
jgi:hypothetical protein